MDIVIHGHLDTCTADGISGWAWSPTDPAATIDVICAVDGREVQRQSANSFRADLREAGIGTGGHGYRLDVPVEYFDGIIHTIELHACHGIHRIPLAGSPSTFCFSPDMLVKGDFELGEDGLLQGWVINLGMPLQTVTVEVVAEGVGRRSLQASMYRRDLLDLGDGSGKHGYQTVLPAAWYAHRTLSIRVVESKTGRQLGCGPVIFNTESSYYRQNEKQDAALLPRITARNRPLISVLLPVYNAPPDFLHAAICSVRAQSYSRWQLCIADDASPNPEIQEILRKYAAQDSRIQIVLRSENGHICRSSNSALALAQGEFTALLDHDDLLHPDALLEVARLINLYPDVGIIFSDEDKCDENGMRYGPYRKSGWDPELLLGQNCVSHLGVYRTALVRKLGGFRTGYEGSQDYDLALRASRTLTSAQIQHIPRVLYHWRAIPGSTALANTEKSYAVVAMRKALLSHLRAIGSSAAAESAVQGVYCRVVWPIPNATTSVTVILPHGESSPSVKKLIEDLCTLKWPGMEILIGNVRTSDAHNHLGLRQPDNLRLMLAAAKGDICIWLDRALPAGDLRAWLSELISQALRSDVALVGAKLLDQKKIVTSAGFTYQDPADFSTYDALYEGLAVDNPGHGGAAGLCRTVHAIPANAFAGRRKILQMLVAEPWASAAISAMTELSMRARRCHLRTIITPFAMTIAEPTS